MKDVYEILDKMQFFEGQRAGRELWSSKPKDVQDADVKRFNADIETLRDYIRKSPRPDWTPCAEGLPESDQWCDDGFKKTYRVTVEADAGKLSAVLGNPYRYVTTAFFELGEWVLDSEDDEFDESEKVIAWMDQPAPYNPDRKED